MYPEKFGIVQSSPSRMCYIIAERISARQYKSGSILGIYVYRYVCTYVHVRTYVRSSAQARTSRRSLRRRRRLDVYARARIRYRLGVP